MPVKVTMAPMSVRPRRSAAASAAASNGSRCREMVAAIMALQLRVGSAQDAPSSAAGHRREEGDLARARDRGIGFDMGAIDGGADHLGVLEGMGILFAALAEPGDQVRHGRDAG